jgi:hypothetical protein
MFEKSLCYTEKPCMTKNENKNKKQNKGSVVEHLPSMHRHWIWSLATSHTHTHTQTHTNTHKHTYTQTHTHKHTHTNTHTHTHTQTHTHTHTHKSKCCISPIILLTSPEVSIRKFYTYYLHACFYNIYMYIHINLVLPGEEY